MNTRMISQISDALVSMKTFISHEFGRKIRSLSEVDRWKATEFCQFLIYTGPVVLKEQLPSALYGNFLIRSLVISILLTVESFCMLSLLRLCTTIVGPLC